MIAIGLFGHARRATDAMRVVGENATRAAFPLLDMSLAEMDLDEIPPPPRTLARPAGTRRAPRLQRTLDTSSPFQIADRDAAQLNATFLGKETTPEISGGFSCDIEADSAPEALVEAFARGIRLQDGRS